MFGFVGQAGPFAYPLGGLTVLMVGMLLAGVVGRVRGEEGAVLANLRGALLFWGFAAAVLGFLGQCSALYRLTTVVVAAAELSPAVVAEGFAGSFVPTLWGTALLTAAGLGWLLLGGRLRWGNPAAVFLFLAVTATSSCAQVPAPGSLTEGVWVGSGGPDSFLFHLWEGDEEGLTGVVHVMREGKMTSEVAITRAVYQAPALEMEMATGATYRGTVALERGRIRGGLSFPAGEGPEMELLWADPSGIEGYAARTGTGPYGYRAPADLGDGWSVGEPEEVDLSREGLEALVEDVAGGDAGLIHSLQVIRHGRLVLDEYFHGYGEADLHRLASVTKSVSALLVGAAVDRGYIDGPQEPLLTFFPDEAAECGEGWAGERLEHLLTMTMGLDWTPEEAEGTHGTGPDFFAQVLRRDVVDPPGTRWAYVSANVNLLAGVIRQATGLHAEAFAREALFEPLEVERWVWEYGAQDGYALMDGSLQLRPRDLAKLAVLVADGGRWKGESVVSRGWMEEATRARVAAEGPLSGYGYLWWVGELPGDTPLSLVVANGWGSQFVVVVPELELAVVTTGGNEDNGRHWALAEVLVRRLPGLVEAAAPEARRR